MTSQRPFPRHGSETRYKGARNGSYPPCRCSKCQRAHTRACARRTLAHLAGTPPLYPAGPLREHVTMLVAARMSHELIARRARVSPSTIRYLMAGKSKSCLREQALRILAVTPGDWDGQCARPVDGTRRRIQAMYWMGHSLDAIIAASGIGHNTISGIANGRHTVVKTATAAGIARAYRQLSARQGGSERAAKFARARGWHGPLAWGDDIDNPEALPDTAETPDPVLNRDELAAERRDEIWLLATGGADAAEIAARVGMSPNSVRTIRAEQRTGAKRNRARAAA